jgi:2-methylcitrate dehydratase PrpD
VGNAGRAGRTTADLGAFVESYPRGAMPSLAKKRIRLAVLDGVGCILAGTRSEAGRIITSWVADQGGTPDAAILGTPFRGPAAPVALATGTCGHALDFDDYTSRWAHTSVTLLPALLAVGEREGRSGADVLDAYFIGYEVTCRLCRQINPLHYARGWHSTSTVGVLGVAAAVCRLLGYDEATVRKAVGIAASAAGGIRKNFGSMVKPLHAGLAAEGGVKAAELAARGFTADLDILDGDRNFLTVYRGDDPVTTAPPGIFDFDQPLEIEEKGLAVKRHVSCGAIHPAADAILELRAKNPELSDPNNIASISCSINRIAPDILIHHVASTPDQGKFSLEYSLAAALIDGQLGLAQYEPGRMSDPAVQALSRRVRMDVDTTLAPGSMKFPAVVTATTIDGRTFVASVALAKGDPVETLTEGEVKAKFMDCSHGVLPHEAAERAALMLLDLDRVEKLSDLARALTPRSR